MQYRRECRPRIKPAREPLARAGGGLKQQLTVVASFLDGVEVYGRTETDFLGRPATADVIGTSHHVAVPELSFHEVASYERLPGGTVHEYPLRIGVDETLSFRSEAVTCETRVGTEPGSELPTIEPDVAYLCSAAARAGIRLNDDGYETYHTDPEHGLTVRSETALERR